MWFYFKILISFSSDRPEMTGVLVEFLTWPIIRYKREVLFGWVDLLVSFGGIASLFLGFSLLSGVEIIYYFTLRACCMVYKDRVSDTLISLSFLINFNYILLQKQLYQIEQTIQNQPPPPINLSLKLNAYKPTMPVVVANDVDKQSLSSSMGKTANEYKEFSRRRKSEKVCYNFDKTFEAQLKL